MVICTLVKYTHSNKAGAVACLPLHHISLELHSLIIWDLQIEMGPFCCNKLKCGLACFIHGGFSCSASWALKCTISSVFRPWPWFHPDFPGVMGSFHNIMDCKWWEPIYNILFELSALTRGLAQSSESQPIFAFKAWASVECSFYTQPWHRHLLPISWYFWKYPDQCYLNIL